MVPQVQQLNGQVHKMDPLTISTPPTAGSGSRVRILARKGSEVFPLKLNDIAVTYTKAKTVFVIDRHNNKLLYHKNLTGLMNELDPQYFFRVNRQSIVNRDYIRSFKPCARVKLQITLTIPDMQEPIIVSQEQATPFKKWLLQC